MAESIQNPGRPAFLDALSHAYSDRGKGVVLLTGNTNDLFWCEKQGKFLPLEQSLYQALSSMFVIQRLDIATGISYYGGSTDLAEMAKVCAFADSIVTDGDKIGDLKKEIGHTRHSPLPALVLLSEILQGVSRVRSSVETTAAKPKAKPVCTIIQFGGSIFPAGDFDRLGELDRQRLVTFLNLIQAPWYKDSSHLIILVADTKAEVNPRITMLPSTEGIEIELPNAQERGKCVELFQKPGTLKVEFEQGQDDFIVDTAGLTITAVSDLLGIARRSKTAITRKAVSAEINNVLQAGLGEIIRFSRPEHSSKDIIGDGAAGETIRKIFQRCESPKTAVSAILIPGPNGAGKTFRIEAYGADSGWVVIELVGLRGMYFGQTDSFFEKLRLRIKPFKKIQIAVDEAHTQLGSVHKSDTHETEKRLAGNIIKMMGDPTMFGKVLWVLMTSRPDELDPDIRSRAPIQIPIFDSEGDARKAYVIEMFKRKNITIPEDELGSVLEKTANYSNRDFGFLLKEVIAQGNNSVLATLQIWQASASIAQQRRLQKLLAAQNCSYPGLLPSDLVGKVGTIEFEEEIEMLKRRLGQSH